VTGSGPEPHDRQRIGHYARSPISTRIDGTALSRAISMEMPMARLIYGMLMSVDGYIAGPDGGMDLPIPKGALHWHFNAMMKQTSVALYGRRMYEIMRGWESRDEQVGVSEVEVDFARAWQETPKFVFSSTLREVGPNARLVRDDVESVVRSLKAEADGDISVAGAGLAASLSRLRLIDEYQLYLHPVVLGGGKPFFEAGLSMKLTPLGTENMLQGVILLRYAPANGS
jgi:dihydrofolate reductase